MSQDEKKWRSDENLGGPGVVFVPELCRPAWGVESSSRSIVSGANVFLTRTDFQGVLLHWSIQHHWSMPCISSFWDIPENLYLIPDIWNNILACSTLHRPAALILPWHGPSMFHSCILGCPTEALPVVLDQFSFYLPLWSRTLMLIKVTIESNSQVIFHT